MRTDSTSCLFLLTPLREGRPSSALHRIADAMISTHAPAGGATLVSGFVDVAFTISTHAPAGGATGAPARPRPPPADFYSHPCGRGDSIPAHWCVFEIISTHAPAGGATRSTRASRQSRRNFYSRPCGRGDTPSASLWRPPSYFYSRPCGRGDDVEGSAANTAGVFLLTPLREGRHTAAAPVNPTSCISTHAPAGGATRGTSCPCLSLCNFYSRPCGRGDKTGGVGLASANYFYSRPCGRGDGQLRGVA